LRRPARFTTQAMREAVALAVSAVGKG